ncbi:MobF family relaxase [Mycolicibacterium arseniciresistens]|uniref:MobF family relaxase n=1 Tax=Mycolicibacterium arseniciresistens TaxID=3062257 RepID=A0ABT8UA90_9MYCO|nr:MobF family relaxase [Mycolicibacterium arseniciresistens]MDO3634697.1 MobF family relaxase [Mycolicibacterium arseniciresistens]
MLTVAKLSRWSIDYYNDTARAAGQAAKYPQKTAGGLGEYYSEHDTRTPTWLCAGNARRAAELVGLSDVERAGGQADPDAAERWLQDGETPNGACGRSFGRGSVHGFDLTFCAPKSVSLLRAIGADDVVEKAIATAHATAISEAMEYLTTHAGYTRVHNAVTGKKDLVRLPGLVSIAYQHETSRAGDPHLHTHVIVPNRQARADGVPVSIDGTSLYHEAKAAGVIYQATLRRELHRSLGLEWLPVDPATGMAEVAGISPETINAWSRRSSQLRDWAAGKLAAADGGELSAAQLATAQKATRSSKSEQWSWTELRAGWRTDERGLSVDGGAQHRARHDRLTGRKSRLGRRRIATAAECMEKAAFTRADLIEIVGAQLPVDTARSPREMVESAVDEIAVRLTAPREAHEREGHERFTLDVILAEEAAVFDLIDARDARASLWMKDADTDGLSADQERAVKNIATSPFLVQPLSAPAGAGKTTSMRALAAMARRRHGGRVFVLAPTGKAVDIAVRDGAGDIGYTIAKALQDLRSGSLRFSHLDLVIVDEAGMAGTDDLRRLLTATTAEHAKAVLVGDAHQLDPVKARGGMFAQLCDDLPWTQKLSEVWRMRDPGERAASLAVRDGGPSSGRRAIDWYRRNDRLRSGDPVAMAADALSAYAADTNAGKDSILVADTKEMADALNRRLHRDSIEADAPTVTAARGHQIAIGDLIISRRNDPAVTVLNANDGRPADPVRNGNRWQVYAVDPENQRIAARRLDDGARAAFADDYLREHITYGYAVTVHSAQGVTTDTTHAVLGESVSRAMFYVAMTRGRDTNTAYLYERLAGERDHEHRLPDPAHRLRRGSTRQAAELARHIVGADAAARTAHDVASRSADDGAALPEHVKNALQRRIRAVQRRRHDFDRSTSRSRTRSDDRDRSRGLRTDQGAGYNRGL